MVEDAHAGNDGLDGGHAEGVGFFVVKRICHFGEKWEMLVSREAIS